MTLKLERDQARAVVDNFFPYLEMLCETKYQDYTRERDQLAALNVLIIRDLLLSAVNKFDRKLCTQGKKFTFKFSAAESIALCSLFMQLPINANQVWLHNLRQLVISSLDMQIKDLV